MEMIELIKIAANQIKEERALDRQYHQFLTSKNLKREAAFYEERINVLDTIYFELNDILEGRATDPERIKIMFLRN